MWGTRWGNALLSDIQGAPPRTVRLGVMSDGFKLGRDGAVTIPFQSWDVGHSEGARSLKLTKRGEPVTLEIAERKLLRAIFKRSHDDLREASREILERTRTRTAFIVLAAGASAIVLLVLIAAFQLSAALGRVALRHLPPEVETRFGAIAWSLSSDFSQEANDPVLTEAVQAISSRLLSVAPVTSYKFEFHVVRSSQVNALSYPGGVVVIYTGLLAQAKSADEVAGVLAHEISHVTHRHVLDRLGSSLGLKLLVSFAFGTTDDSILKQMAPQLFELQFSRSQEDEADHEGTLMMLRAGADPRAFERFFERLAEEEGELGKAISFLSDHPASTDRVQKIEEAIADAGPKLPQRVEFALDWAAVQAHASEKKGAEHRQATETAPAEAED
ncbi:MAG: M48 family metallopeptidase [Bdellovibrionota bacterium]